MEFNVASNGSGAQTQQVPKESEASLTERPTKRRRAEKGILDKVNEEYRAAYRAAFGEDPFFEESLHSEGANDTIGDVSTNTKMRPSNNPFKVDQSSSGQSTQAPGFNGESYLPGNYNNANLTYGSAPSNSLAGLGNNLTYSLIDQDNTYLQQSSAPSASPAAPDNNRTYAPADQANAYAQQSSTPSAPSSALNNNSSEANMPYSAGIWSEHENAQDGSELTLFGLGSSSTANASVTEAGHYPSDSFADAATGSTASAYTGTSQPQQLWNFDGSFRNGNSACESGTMSYSDSHAAAPVAAASTNYTGHQPGILGAPTQYFSPSTSGESTTASPWRNVWNGPPIPSQGQNSISQDDSMWGSAGEAGPYDHAEESENTDN